MKEKKQEGTLVMELNHSGISDKKLTPEVFDEHQLAVLALLPPDQQEKIRKGYPVVVMDLESQTAVAEFNVKNIKPAKWQIDALARAFLPDIQEFYSIALWRGANHRKVFLLDFS